MMERHRLQVSIKKIFAASFWWPEIITYPDMADCSATLHSLKATVGLFLLVEKSALYGIWDMTNTWRFLKSIESNATVGSPMVPGVCGAKMATSGSCQCRDAAGGLELRETTASSNSGHSLGIFRDMTEAISALSGITPYGNIAACLGRNPNPGLE